MFADDIALYREGWNSMTAYRIKIFLQPIPVMVY